MTTSGAPLPAEIAVWNLSYSSPPAPAGYGPEQTAPYSGAGGYEFNLVLIATVMAYHDGASG